MDVQHLHQKEVQKYKVNYQLNKNPFAEQMFYEFV